LARPRLVELALREGPLLQVALDFASLEDAVRLAARLRREISSCLVYEAGTPLIKSVGMSSVRLLAAVAGPCPVLADTKTMDTGALEARLAAEAGADAVTVLAVALDETIREAAEEAHKQGMAIAADLIGVKDPVARAEELASLGVDIVEVHVGIDAQRTLGMSAADLVEAVKRIKERFPGAVAVAGGLNAKTAPRLVEAGADIVVVGGAITRSPEPTESAKAVLEAIKRAARA